MNSAKAIFEFAVMIYGFAKTIFKPATMNLNSAKSDFEIAMTDFISAMTSFTFAKMNLKSANIIFYSAKTDCAIAKTVIIQTIVLLITAKGIYTEAIINFSKAIAVYVKN